MDELVVDIDASFGINNYSYGIDDVTDLRVI